MRQGRPERPLPLPPDATRGERAGRASRRAGDPAPQAPPGDPGRCRRGCSLALPLEDRLRDSWTARGVGGRAEVIVLALRQPWGEGAQSKVVAPGLAPLGAAGAAAAVNMFIRLPRPSPPQEPLSEAWGPPATSRHLLSHQYSSYCPNWTGT